MSSTKDEGKRKLLGRLIRSYREDSSHGGGTLSQDALLYLMSVHNKIADDGYADSYDRNDLTRWEEGNSPIPHQFLRDFCTALAISQPETNRVLWLAGFSADHEDRQSGLNPTVTAMKSSVRKIGPSGAYLSIGTFSSRALGFNNTEPLILISYVTGLLFLIIALVAWHWRKFDKSDEMIDNLFFASLLIVLNIPLLLSAFTRMDPYGFFAIPTFDFDAGVFPFTLAMFVNLALSLIAWVMFFFLRYCLYEKNWLRTHAYLRAVGTTLPPMLFVYAIAIIISSHSMWIYNLIVFGILFGAFTAIMAFNDPDVQLSEWEVKWVPIVTIQVIVILCLCGVAGVVVTYLEPSLVIASARHNLLWSWESWSVALGYPESEFIERFKVGTVLMSLATIMYLATVVGSYLVVTIRRSGDKVSTVSR